MIDLDEEPPKVTAFVIDPPVYQPISGILHDSMICWAIQGNNAFLPGSIMQRPGVVRVDPKTPKEEWLINNFHGFFFGGLNDLIVDPRGEIWYTGSGKHHGKRNIFQSLEGSPGGLKVAANGYLVVGSRLSNGADILDSPGSLYARSQTNHLIENVAFVGPDLKTLFLTGIGHRGHYKSRVGSNGSRLQIPTIIAICSLAPNFHHQQ